MIYIKSGALLVSLLDPREDSGKLGPRYCTGGYIWQVQDAAGRSLLSGPYFPLETPPVFDGQGMPEVFEIPLGGGEAPAGGEVCVIGVGVVKKTSAIEPFHPRNNPRVTKFCSWDIEHGENFAVMSTEQCYKDKSIKLKREVRVNGKQIESINRVKNTGGGDITLRWFSHPFLPLNANFACGKISPHAALPQSAGYRMDANGAIFMKEDYAWEKGLFQLLDVPESKLSFDIPHPVCGSVKINCGYNVIRCALWANANTFSFEPFLQRTLKAGEELEWRLSICFS
jgi:hypothetical protein